MVSVSIAPSLKRRKAVMQEENLQTDPREIGERIKIVVKAPVDRLCGRSGR